MRGLYGKEGKAFFLEKKKQNTFICLVAPAASIILLA